MPREYFAPLRERSYLYSQDLQSYTTIITKHEKNIPHIFFSINKKYYIDTDITLFCNREF